MVYDDSRLHFYLDGKESPHTSNDDGDMKIVANPVVVGQAGTGTSREYFTGYIDEGERLPLNLATRLAMSARVHISY